MEIFRKRSAACLSPRPSRASRRALLRRGATGETDAYLTLATSYFNLLSEHLFLCNFDGAEVLRETERILREGWKRLPYLKRLSDWEYFLARTLLSTPVGVSYSKSPLRPAKLVELPPEQKFALIAFDLENWEYPWLSLALRVSPKRLTNILFQTRCTLLGIDSEKIDLNLRPHFARISASLDGSLRSVEQRETLEKLSTCNKCRDFKSRWLDHRCQLIELRQQIRLDENERDAFLESFARDLSREEMLRPSLLTRARNVISFQEVPPEHMMPPRPDFRYSDG